MRLSRFFVEGIFGPGDEPELRGDDGRKLAIVLRKHDGDPVELCDSSGSTFRASLMMHGARVRARIEAVVDPGPSPHLTIVLAQAVPKGQKMDFIVEKATELGIERILPLATERAVPEAGGAAKVERWRRLARAAAQQCGRSDLPAIEQPVSWPAFCGRFGEFDRVLIPWELAERTPLRDRLPGLLAGARTVAVAIGPEGGFSHAEVERAREAGATEISLGSRILRTETAGLVACAALRYAAGDL